MLICLERLHGTGLVGYIYLELTFLSHLLCMHYIAQNMSCKDLGEDFAYVIV